MEDIKKVFSIHFPGKQVYVNSTFKTLEEKIEEIKNDKDHRLYIMLKEYPNPEIRFECYKDQDCNEIFVALKYLKFKLLN